MGKVDGFEVAPGEFKPLIVATLRVAGQSSDKLCLVDSGADGTLVSSGWLAECGVDYNSLPVAPFKGTVAGGQDVELRIVNGELIYEGVTFATQFVAADPGPLEPLLGRAEFFRHFAVNFSGWLLDPPYFRVDRKRQSSVEHRYVVSFRGNDPETPPTKDEQIALAREAARKLGVPNSESTPTYRVGRNSNTGETFAYVEWRWEGLR